MEDKDKNEAHKPGKSIWKKSNFKQENVEKSKKNLRFNLNLDVHSDNEKYTLSPKQDGKSSQSEPSPKKRKKDMDMPNIPNEVEREIEFQYHSKAKESKLTTRNVKTILKSVITNKYVVDMVRAAEEGGQSVSPFELKLTRAKTKELLQQHPAVPVPPVVELLTNVPSTSDLSPEIELLINNELAEDSSDEEYNPENEPDPSEDEEKGDASAASDLDSLPPTPASSQAPPTPVHETSFDLSQDGLFKVPQENVGQRTRSKLDFHNLPLECIEQALVPPDITADMYEAECDNPDWQDFLKEFTQPLAVNETLDDDPENDPEYNILEDEEKDPVDYKEEMRKDKAVKVSKKELNSLMKELFETDSLSSDDDEARTSESIAELEASIMKETEDRQRREEEERKKKQLGFHPNQRLLLAQQLRQHVQLTTQHFLQVYRHPSYHRHADTCRTMLVTLSGLKNDKVCGLDTHNLAAAMDTVVRWENIHNQPETGTRIKEFVADQIKAECTKKMKKRKMVQQFSPEMIGCIMESEAFLYPMLLPRVPFSTSQKATGPSSFTPSEDMLLALYLEQVSQLMEENEDIYKKRTLVEMCHVICQFSIPRSNPVRIANYIRKLKCSRVMNPVKAFFENGKPPVVCHYVIPVLLGKKLCQQPSQLLPEIWRSFLAVKNKGTGESQVEKSREQPHVEAKPSASIETKKQVKYVLREKKKEMPKAQKNDRVTAKEVKTKIGQNQNLRKVNEGAGESKGFSNHKENDKALKQITINNIMHNGRTVNKKSSIFCEKPKTTRKDLCSMLARKNSIEQAVKYNGQMKVGNNRQMKIVNPTNVNKKTDAKVCLTTNVKKSERKQSTNPKPNVKAEIKIVNPTNVNKKTDAEVCLATSVKKSERKQSTKPKPNVKAGTKCSSSNSSEKIDPKKPNCFATRKSSKSKAKVSNKKKVKFSALNTSNNCLIEEDVPKIKFRVVSKCSIYSKKSGSKQDNISLMVSKDNVSTNFQHEYLNYLGLSPHKIVGYQDHNGGKSFSSVSANTVQTNLPKEIVEYQENNGTKSCSSVTTNTPQTNSPKEIVKYQENNGRKSCSSVTANTPQTNSPKEIVEYQENNGAKSCSSVTTNKTQPNSHYFESRLQSESDSHHSNSIESERTPLCVNIVKSCGSVESHSPRPPSTVKLKDRLNSGSVFKLYSDKTKVPSTVYSHLNGSR